VSNVADMTAQKNGAPVPVILLYAVTGQVGATLLAIHSEYFSARAVLAEEYAERAIWPSLAESYRRVAESYWALALQRSAMMRRRGVERMPEINAC
jgi:hypothetical protein